ncbi:MAG TPA: hypothetical protein VMW38_09955 [Terriglobia bacterium]|nr:hypothetical protein [Terriglobia bacterium]
MLNLDYSNLIIISVPGFILGLMTARFLARPGWQVVKTKLGVLGKVLVGLSFLVFLGISLIVLGVMVVYLFNFPETAKPAYFWYTALFGLWMIINLLLEFIDLGKKRSHAYR